MGTNNLVDQTTDEIIEAEDPNQYRTALGNNIVPRNASGQPAFASAKAGTSTYPFKQAGIKNGYFYCGQIVPYLSYDQTFTLGQGWMPCNQARIIKSVYDGVHGAGSWDQYIITSPLEGKYTPYLEGSKQRFMVGTLDTTDDTTYDISSPVYLPSVGNPDHEYDVAGHTHTQASHAHSITRTLRTIYNSGILLRVQDLSTTGNHNSTFSSHPGYTLTMKPRSIAVQFAMRII